MSFQPVDVVRVVLWGKQVGAVALDPRLGFYAFEYDRHFIRSGIQPAPLTMPTVKAIEPFVFTSLPEMTYKRLPAMLADALPDDFGNALIDAYMAAQGISKNLVTSLDRLAYMGKRGMGALEFHPIRGPHMISSTAIKLGGLVESARRVVHGDIGSDNLAHAALMQIIQVGTSAGGARAKAAIAWNQETNEIRAGQFEVEPGFEHWLLKLDGLGKDKELGASGGYGRIEYGYYLMATEAGIIMAPARLLEENGRAHYMVKRFDRDGNAKTHMQSLCAMAHLDYKQKATHDYSQAFQVIRSLDLGSEAAEEMFRRMVFNVMTANCDDHTKNISFLMGEDGMWKLSPAYDMTFAYNPVGEWTYQHLMSVNGKFKDITTDDMLAVADRFGVGRGKAIIDQVREVVADWPDYAKGAGVNSKVSGIIRKELVKRASNS